MNCGRKMTGRGTGKHTGLKEFIAWDGEGITIPDAPIQMGRDHFHWEGSREVFRGFEYQAQPYVLLANSKGGRITRQEGLHTIECLELILNTKVQYPHSIFVGFGFNYDVNQILADIPEGRKEKLHEEGRCRIGSSYYIKWLPRKMIVVSHRPSGRSAVIYDVFSHFQSSFLVACEKYLGVDDPELDLIRRGKGAREVFKWEELDEFIIPYNDTELSMLVRIMDKLREDYAAVDLVPSQWHGPGAIVQKAFKKYNIPIVRHLSKEILDASQYAYAGGRFEQFWMGRYEGTTYEYDLHSAYPAAAIQLPDLSHGYWEAVSSFQPSTFGVWYCSRKAAPSNRPQPLFCRSETGLISYPNEVRGWYWTPEAELVPDDVEKGFVFHPTTERRPFSFIEEMYDQRRLLKSEGNSSERALKLCMNSAYGKLCQCIGGEEGPPRWHQLEYAGYITSYVRALIYKAILLAPDSIIAVETDAVFSDTPLDLPMTDNLGDWELSTFDEITYLQSGFYYGVKDGVVTCKYRGMDRAKDGPHPDGLPYEVVLDYLKSHTGTTSGRLSTLRCSTTRFVGLGLSLATSAVWRSWEKKRKYIRLDETPVTWKRGKTKRIHIREECAWCEDGVTMYEEMHPLWIGGYQGESFARQIPWRTVRGEVHPEIDWREWYALWEDSQYPHGGLER
jgi:hypothetical protein